MNDMRELEQALDACLEQMATEGIDLDAALSRYPQLADELRPVLELAIGLDDLPPIQGPAEGFREQLAAALDAAPEPATLAADPAPGVAPTTELVRALDAALEAEADARAVLDQHPELETELAPLVGLATALRGLPATESPADSFRGELASAIADAPAPASAPASRGVLSGLVGGLSWLRFLWRSTAATAAVAATVIIFVAAGVTYASADALPGSPLYTVKRTSERARLLLASGDAEMALHLAFADTRLFEALSVPPFAGDALADFSREVTAALVVADSMMARGDSRDEVAPPLLAWLLGARSDLIDGRPALPPTAWRASLAMCDEAIAALRGDATLAVAPVPRLSDPAAILARLGSASRYDRSPVAWRIRRSEAASMRERRPGADVPGGDSAAPPDRDEPGERLVYVIVTATPAPVQVAMVDGSGDASDASESGASESGAGEPAPRPTEPRREPTRPPARPSAAPSTEPQPSNTPFEPPSNPTETTAPPEPPTELPIEPTQPPTDPPAATDVPTQTAVPSADPATPTTLPTSPATPTSIPVINKQPVINDVQCDDGLLDLYKATTCHVVAYDPEGVELEYLWVADAPQMLNERQKDATYYAAWGVGGGTLRVRIAVYVSDEGEASPDGERIVSGETYIDVRSLADSGDASSAATR